MAIDTRDKRASVLALVQHGRVFPNPDGTLDTQDRMHILTYRGIAAASFTYTSEESNLPPYITVYMWVRTA